MKKINETDVARVTSYRRDHLWHVEMADVVAAVAPRLSDALRAAADRLDGIKAPVAEREPAVQTAADVLFDPRDVAKRLNVSERQAQVLMTNGSIKGFRIGRLIRCTAADCERYVIGLREGGKR